VAGRAVRVGLPLVAGCAAVAGGCLSRPVAPELSGDLTDPRAVSVGVRTLEAPFETAAIRSLTFFAPVITTGSAAAALRAGAGQRTCAGSGVAPLPALPFPAAGAAAPFPDSLLRRVFVWDTGAVAYSASRDTSGPPDGVRFTLYALDNLGGIALPLAADGWLDLRDQPGGRTDTLQVHIQDGATANADYRVTPAGTRGVYTARLDGTVTNGLPAVAFGDSTTASGFQSASIVTLDDARGGTHLSMVVMRVRFDPFDYNDTLDMTFTQGRQTVRLTGTVVTYCLLPSVGVRVSVNGVDFATITNGPSRPTVTRLDGRVPSADQSQALLDLLDAHQSVMQWLAALFEPVRLLLLP